MPPNRDCSEGFAREQLLVGGVQRADCFLDNSLSALGTHDDVSGTIHTLVCVPVEADNLSDRFATDRVSEFASRTSSAKIKEEIDPILVSAFDCSHCSVLSFGCVQRICRTGQVETFAEANWTWANVPTKKKDEKRKKP
jgi:hypothetical protein